MTDDQKTESLAPDCGCIAGQDCYDPRCRYPEAHAHGFACDKTCGCLGRGHPVIDPEAHPAHREWHCTCEEAPGRPGTTTESYRQCLRHVRQDDL